MKKALIAMSGGVDSSVAAYLMQQQGYLCAGATMQMCDSTLPGVEPDSAAADARVVAQRLGMEHFCFDCTGKFKENVVEPFIKAYEDGLTPNPCVLCNQTMKFGDLLDKALSMGFDCVATGHYATIHYDAASGRYLLYKAPDEHKDQSYFLAGLTQHQLAHTAFPLGALTKEQVRTIAQEQGFINAHKKDSQDICFISDGDYVRFMKAYTNKDYAPGEYLDLAGNIVGRHCGAVCYTLGQRKGLGLAMGAPVYVCAKDMKKNTVTLGPDDALFAKTLIAKNWNWIAFPELTAPMELTAKARSRHHAQPAIVYPEENGTARVTFHEPQRAMTPGQAVVLYNGDQVIGAGTIIGTEK